MAYLAVVHAGAWGKERAGRGGTARRDPATGASRPGRSTAAHSPAGERARRLGGRRRRQGSTDSPLESLGAAVAALRKERKRAAKTESGEGRMALGFKGAAAVAGFVPAMRADGHRIGANGRD